ncbi:MAG: hypothetical protein WKF58_09605 [Ilumatobacteraceae bacterium]
MRWHASVKPTPPPKHGAESKQADTGLAAVIGWQPDHAARILDDAAGGTPQRMVWFTGIDPAIPDTRPTGPARSTTRRPSHTPVEPSSKSTTASPQGIRRRALSRARGDTAGTDPLDAHLDLCRLKIAAVHAEPRAGRLDINPDDWRLAGPVAASSRSVRSTIVEHARSRTRQTRRSTHPSSSRPRPPPSPTTPKPGRSPAQPDPPADESTATEAPEVTRREITQAIRSNHRKLVTVDEIIEAAIAEGWIVASGDNYIPGESRPA